jgi:hypothetical protein
MSCVVGNEQDGEFLATLCDISRRGVGLTFCFRPAIDTLLPVGLPNSHSRRPYLRLLRVAYAEPLDECRWQGGGQFVRPLSEEELRSILHRINRKSAR